MSRFTIRRSVAALSVAALVVLAGCAGGFGNGPSSDGTAPERGGTVSVYVSDEPNAIGDFERLNVTVTEVGFHAVEADEPAVGTNETMNRTNGTGTNASVTANASGWRYYDVENRTVDLTRYQGAKATKLDDVRVENGSYDKVFLYVSAVEGTLEGGETVDVKLPSERLHVNKGFSVGDGERVDFVFDITVVRAGASGTYVLKPVIAESGTDVPIEADDHPSNGSDGSPPTGPHGDEGTDALAATFDGELVAGENATVSVTRNGTAVAGANVTVDGAVVGRTNGSGEYAFDVPDDEDLTVVVEANGEEVRLRYTLERRTGQPDESERGEGEGPDARRN